MMGVRAKYDFNSLGLPASRKALILVFASLLLLAQTVPLLSRRWVEDETWYSAPAHSLVTRGELRMPLFAEGATQSRVVTIPPLPFITLAGFFKVFGTSLYAAKLPFLLCAIAGIFLTYRSEEHTSELQSLRHL